MTTPARTAGFAIVCGVRRRRKRCTHCQAWAEYECDACDTPLCPRCRIHVPPDHDYCRAHRIEAQAAAAELRRLGRGA
jgi:hypothetical protein